MRERERDVAALGWPLASAQRAASARIHLDAGAQQKQLALETAQLESSASTSIAGGGVHGGSGVRRALPRLGRRIGLRVGAASVPQSANSPDQVSPGSLRPRSVLR